MQSFTRPLALALLCAGPAAAQDSAVKSAADAFGERVGIEQLGLYSESEVRGFDLQSSGAYRIDDAYFVRASPLNDPALTGVGVRVGVNAARLAYPAPSGVVNYRLREPTAQNSLRVGAGFRDFGTQVVETYGSWKSPGGEAFITGGAVARPYVRWAMGTSGRAIDLGGVAGWSPIENHRIRAFASYYSRTYDGDYGVLAADGALPPPVRRLHQYSPDWARVRAKNINLGVLYDGEIAGWSLDASAFRSIYDVESADFTVMSVKTDGDATATVYRNAPRTNVSDSFEGRVSRVFGEGAVRHLASASVRVRRSTVELSSSLAIPVGGFNLAGETPFVAERPWSGTRGEDRVDQLTTSLGYGLLWDDRLQLRLGAHRTRYEKEVAAPNGAFNRREEETTLYNASLVWSLTPRTSLFASWVTGLEETGTAPQSATNANDVLAPVEAEQKEIGVRYGLTDRLTLIGAVFEVSKPTVGFRADGSFGLVGEVAHKGVEASLAGKLDDRTDIVLGAVAFRPEVSGELVEAGVIGDRAVGVSDFVANGSIEREIGRGWSMDAQVNYSSARWADMRNTVKSPALTTVSLGARRRFEIAGRQAQFRILGSNLTDERGYRASQSTFLWPIEPRSVRATLSLTFGG